jgi:hypothetical protein
MLVWLALVGIEVREMLAMLLSTPGTGSPCGERLVVTGVFRRSSNELTLRSGVWTAM